MENILVTGANRGIGFAIAQVIGKRLPKSNIILACRNASSATEAIQSLHDEGVTATMDFVELDIEDDVSIAAAVTSIEQKYGSLDVLINNAGKVTKPSGDQLSDKRHASNACFNNLVTSNSIVAHAFGDLLRKSPWPRVIMVSSARGSIFRTTNGQLPAVANIDYCVSKAALNMLTIHLQAVENAREDSSGITFWAISPGHCKTAFNGYRGLKDPLEGAESVVRLLESSKGEVASGTFWEYEEGEFRTVPW